jgi:hypothetical protein
LPDLAASFCSASWRERLGSVESAPATVGDFVGTPPKEQ